MHQNRRRCSLLLTICLALTLLQPAALAAGSDSVTVRVGSGGDYKSVGEALSALPPVNGTLELVLTSDTEESGPLEIPADRGIAQVILRGENGENYAVGGKSQTMYANGVPLRFESGKLYYLYGGGRNRDVENASLRITGGCVNWIFGGGMAEAGQSARVTGSALVSFQGAKMNYYGDDYVWAGGETGGHDCDVRVNQAEIRIEDSVMHREIYGGSYAGRAGDGSIDTCTLSVSGSRLHGDLFGSGAAETNGAIATVGHTRIEVTGSDLISWNDVWNGNDDKGTIYGGGFADNAKTSTADVLSDCTIAVKDSSIYEVYSGPIAMSSKTCRFGTASVDLENTEVYGNLYAGGVSYDGVAVAEVQRTDFTLRGQITFLDPDGGHLHGEGYIVANGEAPVLEGTTVHIQDPVELKSLEKVEALELAAGLTLTESFVLPDSGVPTQVTFSDSAAVLRYAGPDAAPGWFTAPDGSALPYTAEPAAAWTAPPAPSTGGRPAPSLEVETSGGQTTAAPKATEQNGKAVSTLTQSEANSLVAQAERNQSETVVLAPKVSDSADTVEVSLPHSAVAGLSEKTEASLAVDTPAATVILPHEALEAIASGQGGTLTVSTGVREQGAVAVDVLLDGARVERLTGGVSVRLPAAEAGPGTVAILLGPDGGETLLRKAAPTEDGYRVPLEGSAVILLEDRALHFPDSDAHWAEEAVSFVTARGLFNGVSGTAFSPDLAVDRGMLAAVLYRLEDQPDAGSLPFHDVEAAQYYAPAVAWASEHGVMSGVGDGAFSPKQPALREHVAAALYRYAQMQGLTASAGADTLSAFADGGQVSDWSGAAMAWCVENGLLQGRPGGRLAPQEPVSRAELAALLERLIRL